MEIPFLKTGDIVLVAGPGPFSRAIRLFSRVLGEKKTVVNHAGIITRAGTVHTAVITEALWHVSSERLWTRYAGTGTKVAVFRPLNIGSPTRREMTLQARAYNGMKYGWGKIILHGLDRVLLNGAYGFRRLAFLPRRPICSYLVAQVYGSHGLDFGVEIYEAQPDDIWDYVTNSNNYRVILPLQELRTFV